MKKLTHFGWATIALFMVLAISCNAKADCSKAVDLLCNTFKEMTKQVNEVQDLQGFENLDFDKSFNSMDSDDISDSCEDYVLTVGDKTKVKNSFKSFCNALNDKIVSLMGGTISRSMMEAQTSPMMERFNKIVDSSTTLGDLIEGMTDMNF